MTPRTAGGTDQAAMRFTGLLGVDGKRHSLAKLAGKRATVLVFISGGCPTARSYQDPLIGLQARWHQAGSGWCTRPSDQRNVGIATIAPCASVTTAIMAAAMAPKVRP